MEIEAARKMAAQILGRVAHLLTDMSVPAHVHNDLHADGDGYEVWMGQHYFEGFYEQPYINPIYWDAWNAARQGDLIDVYQAVHANDWIRQIRYLFYTMNQIADRFPSNDFNGDNVYSTSYYSDDYSVLNLIQEINHSYSAGSVEPYQVNKYAFRYCIRAVAGLFYWFATQTGMLRVQIPININSAFEFEPTEYQSQPGYIAEPITISVQNPIIRNGKTYIFYGWNDENTSNPPTITPIGEYTLTANYKAHLLTSSNSSTSFGSQRKITRDAYNGKLHMIYTSSDKIWYTTSTDQGTTWSSEQRLSGSGIASNPSIASSGLSWGDNEIYFTWQETVGSTRNLYFKSTNYSTPLLFDSDPTGSDMQSVIAASSDESKVLVLYKKMYSGRYQIHYKYSSNGGSSFTVGGPLQIGTPVIYDFPSIAWNPQSNKFMISASYKTTSYVTIELFSFNGTTWVDEYNVYYSNQVPAAQVYSQVSVDGTGRTHITWIAYDNQYQENSAAMHRSVLNGNWSTIRIFRDEVIYDPSIVYTSVCGHNDADGGASIFYSAGSQQTLFDLYSTNNTSWNGYIYISPTAPIRYPVALEKSLPTSVSYVTVKGSASPYEIKTQTKNNSQTGSSSGTLKIASENEVDVSGLKNIKLYRRAEIIDTINNGILSVQFGNIKGKAVSFLDIDNVSPDVLKSSFLNTNSFNFENNDSLLVEFGIKSKDWKNKADLIFELIDTESGTVLGKIGEYKLTSQKASIKEEKLNKIVNRMQNTNASLRINIDGLDYKGLIVNYIDAMIFSDSNNTYLNRSNGLTEIIQISAEYLLSQNYPNPFNPTTTISFSLPQEGKVAVKIYDIMGRELITLLDDMKSAGNHKVVWEGKNTFGNDVASGVYFYNIRFGDKTITKKMLLVR